MTHISQPEMSFPARIAGYLMSSSLLGDRRQRVPPVTGPVSTARTGCQLARRPLPGYRLHRPELAFSSILVQLICSGLGLAPLEMPVVHCISPALLPILSQLPSLARLSLRSTRGSC